MSALSWKQQKNAGGLARLLLIAPIDIIIYYYIDDPTLRCFGIAIWSSIAYALVPSILKELKIWTRYKK